ncbi:hypothetical protein Tco_1453429, partial [Tanacetum coccineum]
MGELTFFLGLQVKQKDDGIFISQDKYVADILKKFDFAIVKTTSTPIKTNKALLKDEEAKDVDVHLYRSIIRSLMYLTAFRPDIMFVVCAYARFQVTPKVLHLHAVKRIFRYLKGQPKLGLWYLRDSTLDLEGFSDSDYVGASLDKKFTIGEYVAAANYCGQTQTPRQAKRGRDTKIPQSGGLPEKVSDKAVHKELGDRMERAVTTASSLEAEQASGNINKTQFTATLNEPFFLELGSGGHTLRSGDDSMEPQIELTDNVPNTPHDLPLPGVNIPRSDEGSLELNELIDLVTKLSHKVFDLEKLKTAQAKEIVGLKKRVTKLEQRQRSRILKNHPFRFGSSRRQSLGKIGDDDTKVVKGSGDTEVLDTEKAVNIAGEGVSTASVYETVSTATSRTPPTTISVFDD